MQQWEHKVVKLEGGSYFSDGAMPTEAELDELGAEGWELATSLVGTGIKLGGRGGSTTHLVFKRPVEDAGEDRPTGTTGQ